MKKAILLPIIFISLLSSSQEKTDPELVSILRGLNDSLVNSVLDNPDVYRFQIIYTKIDHGFGNKPSFKNYYYNVDAKRYFNPASTVKMPLAFLSLEKLNDLNFPNVNKYTAIQFDSGYSRQTKMHHDSTAENHLPSIAHFIKKAFLISDNDAYNRMYEFIGQQAINRRLHAMGYPDVRITRRFMRMNADENRHTNPIRFIDKNGSLIYKQPSAFNTDSFDFSQVNKMGKGHLNADDSLVNEPIDFTTANNYTLEDMQQQLQSVMFPKSMAKERRFRLSNGDLQFLYRYLSQYPSETNFPKYDTIEYYDSYVKFFFRDSSHKMPQSVRVFNKVGWAYGCLTDVSYVADFENKVDYMLAVTIYVNSDGILNDNKYEYSTIGWPFMYKVGQAIYRHELNRKKKVAPDLSRFTMKYEKRVEDGRPAVKDADN